MRSVVQASSQGNEQKCLLWLVGIKEGQGANFETFLKEHVKPLSYTPLIAHEVRGDYGKHDLKYVPEHEYYHVYTKIDSESEAAMERVLVHMNFYKHVVSCTLLVVESITEIPLKDLK